MGRDALYVRRINGGVSSLEVRRRVCEGIEFLGPALDDGRNHSGKPLIFGRGERIPESGSYGQTLRS